jgi:hemoglobin/transferrin/lactoferrin receptor protein
MKKFVILWVLLALTGGAAFAQTITLRDQETLKPIEGATLYSENPKYYTVTNTQGQADVSRFEGSPEIQIRSLGYKNLFLSFSELRNRGFELQMEPSNLSLDEVVVAARRWREVSSNIASKVVAITPREVALQNPQTAADLLGISGKVFIQKSQQGGGSPMIRGFATNRLVYTVDGVRMNTAIFRGGNIQNVINIDPFATQGTEVLFGPGSVIYGSDAIGGVMSFQTLTPLFSLDGEAFVSGKAIARYASANEERTGHVDVNVGWKNWAFVTSISSWDYNHLRQGSHGPDDYVKGFFVRRQDGRDVVVDQEDPLLQVPSAYSQVNLMQKVRFSPGENWDLQYGFHFSETSPYGRYDRHNRLRDGVPRHAQWDYGPQQWMMNLLTVNHRGNGGWYDEATLRLAQQAFEESRITRDLNDDTREIRVEQVDAWSANLDFVKSLGEKNTFYYGLEYVHNDVASNGTTENIVTGALSDGSDRYPQATWTSVAAYLSDEFRLTEKFTLEGGVRYNYFRLKADFTDNLPFFPFPFTRANNENGALTGSIGGVYRPSEKWVLQANVGTAFRSPNVDDIGRIFDSEPGAVVVPNPDLDAEYAYNLDLGVTRVFGEVAKLEVTGYYTRLQNALVRRDFVLNGQDSIPYDGTLSKVQAIQNAAEAEVYGVQLGVEVTLPAGFSFTSDLNLQKGIEELDDGSTSPSRHAAPLFGVSRLNFRSGKLEMQLYSEYQGERTFEDLAVEERSKDEIYAKDANGNNFSPSWYTLNLKARYGLSETLTLSAGLENITDQRYRPFSSGISGAGRNFILSLQADF